MRWIFIIQLLAVLFSSEAVADCLDPAGPEGLVVYNPAVKTMQFCEGDDWIDMVGGLASGAENSVRESAWEEVYPSDTNDFNVDCEYKFRIGGAWYYPGTVTSEYLLFDVSSGSYKFGAIEKATKGSFSFRNDGSVATTSGPATPIDELQRKCIVDGVPDSFTFADVTGANPSTLTTSSAVTVAGINTAVPVSVTGAGAEISIAGGAWGILGSVSAGQTVAVRVTSSGSFSTAVSTTVMVGTVTDSWSVTTRAADTTPNAFNFTDLSGVNLSSLSTATAITPTGYEAGAAVSVTGSGSPQISINGGAWGTSGTITPGQTIAVRLTSSGSVSSALTATVTIGGVSDTWSVTTRVGSSCSASSKTWLTNCTGTVSAAAHGANGTATITDPGGCGTAYYGSGTFACSDGAFTYSSGTCTQQTACDTTPDAFTFTDVTGADPSTLTTSNTVTITGINTAATVTATGGAQFSINGGGWGTSGSITNGQTLAVRLTSSASYSTAVSSTVTVGTGTDSWSVTTRAPNNCTVASGTTWTVSSSTCTAPSAVNINHGSTGTSTDATAPTTGAKTFSCTDGVLATSGTPTCATASGGIWNLTNTLSGVGPGTTTCSSGTPQGTACPTLGATCKVVTSGCCGNPPMSNFAHKTYTCQ